MNISIFYLHKSLITVMSVKNENSSLLLNHSGYLSFFFKLYYSPYNINNKNFHIQFLEILFKR